MRRAAVLTAAAAAAGVALLLVGGGRAQETGTDTAPGEEAQAASGRTAAEEKAALLGKLPPITFGEGGVATLVVEGVFGPIRQRFELHARGGDDYDLLVSAIEDGEPFLVGRDGTSLAYIPGAERGTVQIFPGLAQIHLALEDGRLRCGIAMIGPQEENAGKRVIVTLDPASVLRGITEDLRVERAGEGRFRLSGSSARGTRMVIDVDPSAAYPLTAMRVTRPGDDVPVLEIARLVVNAEPGPRAVGIPPAATLQEHFDTEDFRARDDAEALAQGLAATFAASGARMRLHDADRSGGDAERRAAARDRRDRKLLGGLVRAAAAD